MNTVPSGPAVRFGAELPGGAGDEISETSGARALASVGADVSRRPTSVAGAEQAAARNTRKDATHRGTAVTAAILLDAVTLVRVYSLTTFPTTFPTSFPTSFPTFDLSPLTFDLIKVRTLVPPLQSCAKPGNLDPSADVHIAVTPLSAITDLAVLWVPVASIGR